MTQLGFNYEKAYEKESEHAAANDRICRENGLDARKVECTAIMHRCFPVDGGAVPLSLNSEFVFSFVYAKFFNISLLIRRLLYPAALPAPFLPDNEEGSLGKWILF